MDTVVPLVDRSISAHTLAEKFDEVLERIDRLRLNQQPGRPTELPPWWTDHLRDIQWLALSGNRASDCSQDRTAYAHWYLERVLAEVLAAYRDLTRGVEFSPAEKTEIQNAETALRAMKSIMSGTQSCPKLYWAVIPDEAQLEPALPKIYTPLGLSDEERRLMGEMNEIWKGHFTRKEIDRPAAERRYYELEARVNTLIDERLEVNLRMQQTMVTAEQHAQILRVVEEWRGIVKQWKLAEAGIRRALQILRGTGLPSTRPGMAAEWSSPPLPQRIDEIIREAVSRAVAAAQTAGGGSGHSGNPTAYWIGQTGRVWEIVFQGVRTPIAKDAGMPYIRRLIQFPNKPVSWTELGAEGLPADVPVDGGTNEPRIDECAVSHYRRRINDAREALSEATRQNDPVALAAAMSEKAALDAEIGAAVHQGRLKTQSAEFTKLKKKIKTAIGRVLVELGEADNPAAKHLEDFLWLEDEPVYRPNVSIPWRF